MSQTKEVARGLTNLGNTCYINSILQSLAHSPELLLAMDLYPHHTHCHGHDDHDDVSRSNNHKNSNKCVLCEVEHLLKDLHNNNTTTTTKNNNNNNDVSNNNNASSTTTISPNEFMECLHLIHDSFERGKQEDSHEFLRFLIDGMQRSAASQCCSKKEEEDEEEDSSTKKLDKSTMADLSNYPLQLFKGTVRSTVTCGACGKPSSTLDPMEDIGLEVLENKHTSVTESLDTFVRKEHLDEYKCDNCKSVHRATKQSQFETLPPILTLHLKRFRYGSSSFLSRGSSGSSKVEGFVRFPEFFDMRPYLTQEFQNKCKKMYCRLFAVVVHTGKNAHSGHYYAYVRNVAKNEWNKMDDSNVTPVHVDEVMNTSAYMLFYRIVDHPVSFQLKQEHQKRIEEEEELLLEQAPGVSMQKTNTKNNNNYIDRSNHLQQYTDDNNNGFSEHQQPITSISKSKDSNNNRKRPPPSYDFVEDWIKKQKLFGNASYKSELQYLTEWISENVELTEKIVSSNTNTRRTERVVGIHDVVVQEKCKGLKDVVTKFLRRLVDFHKHDS